jgi:hypothetical protein
MFSKLLLTAFAVGALCVVPSIDARKMSKHQTKAKQLEAANRWHNRRPIAKGSSGGVQNFTFSNPKAAGEYTNFCRDLT